MNATSQIKQRQGSAEKSKSNTNQQIEKQSRKKSKFITAHEELQAATNSTTHRIWTRSVIIVAVATLVYFYTRNQHGRETKFALVREKIPLRMQKFQCSPAYAEEMQAYPKCLPQKCGRFVADKLVEPFEAKALLDLAQRVFNKTVGSDGGASILDIHTGALSHGKEFINVYSVPKLVAEFHKEDLTIYNFVKGKIKLAIAEQFGIAAENLYLTYPTFFSRITNATAKTIHDEYWHEHVDKETYASFHYTSLLYLNTYKKDFHGGRFIFVDGSANTENRTTSVIEPKMGRVGAFTSGAENLHHVEHVTEGERYAITISFTCDAEQGIADPKIKTI